MVDINLEESILDQPKADLNPQIWNRLDNGSYALREDVQAVVQQIVDWAVSTFKMKDVNVHITGSNTSNSYSSNSDLDVHFSSSLFKADKADEFNKIFRKKFEELATQKPELGEVNGVKIELYMQPNPYQDLMSVGCYDFIGKNWLVGPDLKDRDFDPYDEYFSKDMKSIDDIIDDVRQTILKVYELSIVLLKSMDQDFKESIVKKLKPLVNKAAKMFQKLRARRSHKSQPKNREEALKNRGDKDWQVADSAFKLLDKFGYLGILRACAQNEDRFDEDMSDIEMAVKTIMQSISDKLSIKALDDSESLNNLDQLLELEMQDESLGQMLRMSTIASIMAIGSFLPVNALAKELTKAQQAATVQRVRLNKDSPLVKKAVSDAAKDNTMVGPMSKTNVVNAVAQVLWKEARGKSEGLAGRNAIASVILNRCGSDPSNIVAVLKQKYAFSCLNNYTGGWTDKTYKWYVPAKEIMGNPSNKMIWDQCNQIALDLVEKKFKSTIGNRNAYLNKDTADQTAIDTWGKACTYRVGSHHFGYLKEKDPKYVIPGTHTSYKRAIKLDAPVYVVVKNGDSLSKIAKAYKTTIGKLLSLNKTIQNPNSIHVGQKIRIS